MQSYQLNKETETVSLFSFQRYHQYEMLPPSNFTSDKDANSDNLNTDHYHLFNELRDRPHDERFRILAFRRLERRNVSRRSLRQVLPKETEEVTVIRQVNARQENAGFNVKSRLFFVIDGGIK
jgi:hypothetical protein